jgi:hypothetical protein
MMLNDVVASIAYLKGDVVVLGVDLRLLGGHARRVLGLQEMNAYAVVEQPAVAAVIKTLLIILPCNW